MYETSLCAWHTDTTWEPGMTISVNTPPMISLRWSWDDESYLDSKLQFDWSHDAKFFFRNWLLKFWL